MFTATEQNLSASHWGYKSEQNRCWKRAMDVCVFFTRSKYFGGSYYGLLFFIFLLREVWGISHHVNQFSSISQSCPTLCDPINCSTPGLPVHHQPPEFTQTHVHWVGDALQPSHPLSSPSPPALNLSQHQGLFKWVSSSHQVAKILKFQLQHQSFQWTPRTDLL